MIRIITSGRNDLRICLFTLSIIIILQLMVTGCAPGGLPDSKTKFILLATTTSTYDSGLLDFINPIFTEQTGIEVRVVPQGTGAALEAGRRGDADVLLVHDRVSEIKLVDQGYFVNRYDVMYNDFIILGPTEDPAGVAQVNSAPEAFSRIAAGQHPFVSRGDDSGTHRMELSLWEIAGVDLETGDWYLSIGQGMGETLRVAHQLMGYTLTDRGTYLASKSNLGLSIVLTGDPLLFNQYGAMAVNPEKHSHVKYDYALKYIEFLMSDKGQSLIEAYQFSGENLFYPGLGGE